jgi:hypothetical protein
MHLPQERQSPSTRCRRDNLLDWDHVNKELILPSTQRQDIRNPGDRSQLATPLDFGTGTSKRLLEPVTDRAVLARVPDALYIGQKGTVTSTRNRAGETQEYWLSGDAAKAFARAQEMLAAKGKQIIVSDKNGAGRTVDTQTEIYTRSRNGRGFAAGRPSLITRAATLWTSPTGKTLT